VIGWSQRPLPDNTQHSQQTGIHAPGGIRTHDLSRRAALDLCLRLHGHWDRQELTLHTTFFRYQETTLSYFPQNATFSLFNLVWCM